MEDGNTPPAEKSDKSDKVTPYKGAEFKVFLKTLKDGTVGHWREIAEALGVDPDTITSWKRTPEAQAAITEGIQYALTMMQQAGAKDWRMWEAKLKMLGINPATNVDLKSGGKPLVIPIMGGSSVHGDDSVPEDMPA